MIAVAGGIILAYLVIKYPMEIGSTILFLLFASFGIALGLIILAVIVAVLVAITG